LGGNNKTTPTGGKMKKKKKKKLKGKSVKKPENAPWGGKNLGISTKGITPIVKGGGGTAPGGSLKVPRIKKGAKSNVWGGRISSRGGRAWQVHGRRSG